ncbi:hypothetical protein E5Q_01996 [Mixia osmundae IAM 14324]|uniref:Uncharacterized protein n=1 Tax=Mixia osmundae (strain CBS 9802 / IAM 14324 / JCM 22182 / KY 12970) TaxID=764103 RepID=G7DXM9_MIXOS|nr:hypothetical protein E5Q_01996 [Mixia osmundae IAM 14324]
MKTTAMRGATILALGFVTVVHAAVIGGLRADENAIVKRLVNKPYTFTVDLHVDEGAKTFECIFDVDVTFGVPFSKRYEPRNFAQGCQLGNVITSQFWGDLSVVSVFIEVLNDDKTTKIDISVTADVETGTWQAWLLSSASHLGKIGLGDSTNAILRFKTPDSDVEVPRCLYDTKLNQPGINC